MTEQEIVNRFKRYRPRNLEDLLQDCKLTLRYVESGVFRHVYKIHGLPLVVKLPQSYSDEERHLNIDHAREEYNAWRRIHRSKKLEALRPYMPEILYFNRNTGITLMREYKPVPWTRRYRQAMNAINDDVLRLIGGDDSDLGANKVDNYGLEQGGHLKIIDLALLFAG